MVSTLDRLSYAARQTARVAWYAGHYAAGRRLLKPMPKPDFPIGPTPSRAEMTADMRALFEREWRDIAAGLFPAPRALAPEPAEFLRRSLLYFRDLPQVDARRHGRRGRHCRRASRATGCPTTTGRTSISRATAGSPSIRRRSTTPRSRCCSPAPPT